MKREEINYHPKMLKIFTKEELDCLEKEADYSVNEDGFINVMLVNTDKIMVEIFIDCEAKDEECALISLLDNCGYAYPKRLTKDEFWKVYLESNAIKMNCIVIDA